MKRITSLVFILALKLQPGAYATEIAFVGHSDFRQSRILCSIGDKAPGDPGGVFSAFKGFAVNDQGEVVFTAKVEGGRAPGGLFLFSADELTSLVTLGDATPLGGVFGDLIPSLTDDLATDSVFLSDTGTVAFGATVVGGNAPGGIFLARKGGQIEKAVAVGEESPLGQCFAAIRIRAMNQQGDVAFTAKLASGQEGIFVRSNGRIQEVVVAGDPAPNGGIFSNFDSVRLNRSGEIAFVAKVVDRSGAPDRGIFFFAGGSVKKIVLESERSPLRGRFSKVDLLGGPAVSDNGGIAFVAEQSPLHARVVYRAVGGRIEPVFKEGDQPSDGFAVHVAYSGFGLHIYPDGTVAFLGTLGPYPTTEIAMVMVLAGASKTRAVVISVPLPIRQIERATGFYFLRTGGDRILFTILFRNRNSQLEARQIFVAS